MFIKIAKKMKNEHKKSINYTLKVSARAQRMRLSVYHDGRCVVTVPQALPQGIIERFVREKSQWIRDKIEYFLSRAGGIPLPIPLRISRASKKKEYVKYKEQARALVEERIAHFNQCYNYSWNNISIKNQKTRWGSCSSKGNLNFNYKIALLPQHMADYIVVHELCHLGEFNHSQNFWNLVEKTIPEYRKIREELKKTGLRFH